MYSIIINHLSDFNQIVQQSILLTGKKELQDEEIYENMWTINLSKKIKTKITHDILTNFIDELIHKKQEQITVLKQPATFYMWYDSQISDLRFNLLSGHRTKLPFGSTVTYEASPHQILQEFLMNANSRMIPWEELDIDCDLDENEDDLSRITKVYSLFLTPAQN